MKNQRVFKIASDHPNYKGAGLALAKIARRDGVSVVAEIVYAADLFPARDIAGLNASCELDRNSVFCTDEAETILQSGGCWETGVVSCFEFVKL